MPHDIKERKHPFTPEELAVLVAAFDKSWASAVRLANENVAATRELLAQRIVEMAQNGDLDRDHLAQGAVDHLTAKLLKRAFAAKPFRAE